MIKGILGAVIGGAIGAAIWAAISYFAHVEAGIVAWGIGGLVGLGMHLGVRNESGMEHGCIAAVIALASVGAGKYLAVHALATKVHAEVTSRIHFSDDDAKAYLAEQLANQANSEGKVLKWPADKNFENAKTLGDYPRDIAKDAESRWKAMTPEAREGYKAQALENVKGQLGAVVSGVEEQAFKESFSAYDFLWVFLAVGTAFRLGAGMGGGD